MSGIIGVSPNMKSGVVGGYPKNSVIQVLGDTYDPGGSVNITTAAQTFGTNLEINGMQCHSLGNYLKIELFLYGLWTYTGENLMCGFAYTSEADGSWASVGNIPSAKSYVGSSEGYHNTAMELGLDPMFMTWAPVPNMNPLRIRPRFEAYNNIQIQLGANSATAKGIYSLVVSEIQG